MLFIKLVDKLNKVLEILVGLALVTMTAVVFLQIIVRFVLGSLQIEFAVPWTEELARYLMIWAVFIGAAIVARRADSLAVEALIQIIPPTLGRTIKVCAHLIALVFYGYIFFIGLEMAQFGLSEKASVLKVPMVYVYASMSIGAVLTILNSIALLVDIYVNKKDILEVIDVEAEEALADYKEDGRVPELKEDVNVGKFKEEVKRVTV